MTVHGVLAEAIVISTEQGAQTPLDVAWKILVVVWDIVTTNPLVSALIAGVGSIFIVDWIREKRAGAKRPWLGLLKRLASFVAAVARLIGSIRITTTGRRDATQSSAYARGKAKGLEEGRAGSDARVEAAVKAGDKRVEAAIEAGKKQLAQTRRSLGNEARERNQKTDIAAARNKGREEGYEQGLKDGRTASQPLDHDLQAAPKPSPPPLARWKITIEPGQQFVALYNGPTRFILENLSGLSFAMHVRVNGPDNFDFDDAAEWKEFAGGTSQVFAGSAHDASGYKGVEFTVTWIAFGGEVKTDKVRVRPWLHMPPLGSGSVPRG